MKYVIATLAVIVAALLGIVASSCGVGRGAESAGPVPTGAPGGDIAGTETGSGSGTIAATDTGASSIRRGGKSVGQMLKEEVNPFIGLVAMISLLAIMTVLLAVLGLVVVKALAESPWGLLRIMLRVQKCRKQ